MKGQNLVKEWWGRYAPGVAWLLSWIAFSIVGIWIVLGLRTLFLVLAVLVGIDSFVHAAIGKFGLVLFALVWVVAVVLLEEYLRSGAQKGRLRERIVRVALIETGLLGLFYGVDMLWRQKLG